jgi:hypothetical protein
VTPRNTTALDLDEADVLRVAAGISDLLSDGLLHPWADCIDLAADFTGGRRRAASDLAWQALTELIDAPTIWAGEKGARLVGLALDPSAALTVACPTCGSAEREACARMNSRGRTKTPKTWPHEQRQIAAATPVDQAAPAAT